MSTHQNSEKISFYLSKGLVVRGIRCLKSLYLHKYRPDLKDEVTDAMEQRFESGYAIGDLAQGLFPGGVLVPYDGLSYSEQMDMTASLIAQGCKTIYEAAFSYNGVFIKADILHLTEDGWEVYEVKASTGVKDYHLDDASVQYNVMSGTGLPISRVFIVHINNQYARLGDIDVEKLFAKEDITSVVQEKQTFIIDEINRHRDMLNGAEPVINIGPHCSSNYPCDFIGHCWSHIKENSIFDIRGRMDRRFSLYEKGIVSMFDVPEEYLSAKQAIQIQTARTHEVHYDHAAVKAFLDSLWYPLCFFDFETSMEAIPAYDGIRPYQQVPFQYSLHRMDQNGCDVRHDEYLALPRTDPRRGLIEKLVSEIPAHACVLTYNKSFEIARLRDLAIWFPEYKDKIEMIIENIRDLADPFRRYHIYNEQQYGSYSLKYVLPAMIPDFGYDHLDVQNGGMAMDAFATMNQTDDNNEIASIRQSLLEYCKLDTLAMVKILERMQLLVSGNGTCKEMDM